MKTFILSGLFFLASFSLFATGPSEIISEIIPIALAQKKISKVLSKYEFKVLSAKHKIGKTFSYKTFRTQYPAVDENCTQICLEEVKSKYKPETLKVEYQIGNLLFLENSYFGDPVEEEEQIGSNFQCHPDDITEGYYEDFSITGIIVLGGSLAVDNQGDMEVGGFYKMQVLKLEKEGFGIQIGGYTNYAAVLERLMFLESKWFKGTMVAVGELNGQPYCRIVMGPMKTKEEATSYCNNLKADYKLKEAFVVNLAELK